ncbi:MAG: hypothetical protein WBC00_00025 [Candidatus Omnitrophota bacterium]
MENAKNRNRAWIKIIAVVIVCLFTVNNVTWANPDIFQRGAANMYLSAASNFWEPANLFSVQVAVQVYLRGLHKPFEEITEHLFPEVNGEKVHLFFDSNEKRQDETGKWIIPGKKDFIEFEAVIDPENDFDTTIRKKGEKPAEPKPAEPESKPEIDEKTAEEGKTGDGFIHQGELSAKKFEQAPKEDITDEYKERLVSLLEKFTQGVSLFSLAPEHRRALEELIEKIESGGYTIYGLKSIVEGKDDFFLGRHYPGDKEIFLATDFIAELENMCRPHLIDEYLLHELICPTLSHYHAILAQQEFFPDHFPGKGMSKGLLGKALRIFIDQKIPAKEKKSGPGKTLLGLILAVIGGSFMTGCHTAGASMIGGLPIVVILLAVLVPSILSICDRMYYLEALRREKEKEENEEDADRIVEEVEKAVEEMGEELDELADALEEEGEDDLETEVSDEEKHDIREVTIKTVVRYLRSDKKDKNFEEVMGAVIQAIQ